ncbi:UNVERIFIED_ORG: hypothetical protein QFZ59_001844 [Bacillus sp. B2I3]|nr:hypothetical protein [Bacillus sp. B2I3]
MVLLESVGSGTSFDERYVSESFCPQSFYGLYNLDVDLRSRDSLSAGGPGASSALLRLWGLPWTRIPAGVSPLPFQSTLYKKIQFVTLLSKECHS